jgi:hypothetical protein
MPAAGKKRETKTKKDQSKQDIHGQSLILNLENAVENGL